MHPREWIKWRNSSWTCSQAYGPLAYKMSQKANKQRKSCCERQARKQRGRLWFRNSMRVLLHWRRVLNLMVKNKTWGARIFVDFQYSSNKVFLYRSWLYQNSGSPLCIASYCCLCSAGCEKFARVRGLWLVIVEIKLQFLFACYQLLPYVICHHFAWKDNLLLAWWR